MLVDFLKAFLCHNLPVEPGSGRSTQTWGFLSTPLVHPLPLAGAQAVWEKGCTPMFTVLTERVKVANEGS